jgi:hypothetical protein
LEVFANIYQNNYYFLLTTFYFLSMKISHKWLQTYFKKPLPSSDKIAELLTFHIFEVEGIEKKTTDDILDVKVLPDRASY